MKIAIVGATGVIGRKIIEKIEKFNLSFEECFLFASKKSEGVYLTVFGKKIKVEKLTEKSFKNRGINLAFFAVDSSIAKKYVKSFMAEGITVIDNSSYFRLNDDVPLIVPCVNGKEVLGKEKLISNPNCSTIMLTVLLNRLKKFGVERVNISTYQSVSGAGRLGCLDLINGEKGLPAKKFPKDIYSNVIPEIGKIGKNGYTGEEMKIIEESRKILKLPDLKITATAVRVPVLYCHSEAVTVKLKKGSLKGIKNSLKNCKDLIFYDEDYPTPKDAINRDDVLVGRLRKDYTEKNSYHFWLVSDNLCVGASTNAVKIALLLLTKFNKKQR